MIALPNIYTKDVTPEKIPSKSDVTPVKYLRNLNKENPKFKYHLT